ncbi:UDP-3-O-(3-hydroxymyristoyl)glucosamine N-acyltransferase [Roseobacteraceae bacterium S113]
MSYSVKEIAVALGAEAFGATDILVGGVSEPAAAGPSDIALAMKPEFAATIDQGQARVAMLWAGADWESFGLEAAITAPRPRFAMSGLSAMMDAGQGYALGIHPAAVIDESARLGKDVQVGPGAVIGPRAEIGAGCVIGPQAFVGADVVLGAGCYLREHVSIGRGVQIGARFIAQPGVRVGGDGFSYVTPEESGVERMRDSLGDQGEITQQSWARIHSLGGVVIGDDVELGANACVDCGTVKPTRIGNGVKVDNLAQIGHNVEIGDDTMVCAQVGIAGSSVIGRNVVLGGQSGVSDNVFVGDNVITGGATKVLANVPAGRVMLGYPATKMTSQMETYKALRRLPRLFRDVAALQKAVFKSGDSD